MLWAHSPPSRGNVKNLIGQGCRYYFLLAFHDEEGEAVQEMAFFSGRFPGCSKIFIWETGGELRCSHTSLASYS